MITTQQKERYAMILIYVAYLILDQLKLYFYISCLINDLFAMYVLCKMFRQYYNDKEGNLFETSVLIGIVGLQLANTFRSLQMTCLYIEYYHEWIDEANRIIESTHSKYKEIMNLIGIGTAMVTYFFLGIEIKKRYIK